MISHDTDRCTLYRGDCLEVLRSFPDSVVDSLVTDPPAGIGFMGKAWDSNKGGRSEWIAWLRGVMTEALRVLKPGAHALVWAIPRTSHWTATAIEDAGFEIRDVGVHLFGTGFPKSLNIGEGKGTALKPGAEHWILARKPLIGTVAANVERFGTGALNIDGARIATDEDRKPVFGGAKGEANGTTYGASGKYISVPSPLGRWPANVTLDEHAAEILDGQSGLKRAGTQSRPKGLGGIWRTEQGQPPAGPQYGDFGGASRFFYCAKPSRAERDLGCGALPVRSAGEATDRAEGSDGLESPRAGAGRTGGSRNHHPTVKPISLMRWLSRLITPTCGIVLDPFLGSGTTGIGALAEGFRFVGIEKEAEYMEIAKARINAGEGANT